jgi:nondiscriminating aspartyl-tRNA synthetase
MSRILATELGRHLGRRVRLMGWVHNIRRLGEVNFVILRDRSGLAQAVLGRDEIAPLDGLQMGTVITLDGRVVAAANVAGGHELHDCTVQIISPVSEVSPIPLNKKRLNVGQATFLDHAVITHRHPRQQAILRLAAGLMRAFRETLHEHDFVEIQTPKLVASATESGANVFSVDYFGETAYLAQSPQFYKQIMVAVFERVYEVGPVFRAEKHDTARHLNEYVSLDVEFGFIEDHFTVMAMLTTLLEGMLAYLRAHHEQQLAYLDVTLPTVGQAIPHVHIADAQTMLAEKYGVTDAIGEPDLTPEHERLLGSWARETHDSDFLFVSGYPMSKRPFYTHPDPDRSEYSRSFDLLFRGLELVTGGQRLHRYQDYLAAARSAGYQVEAFAGYFEAFNFGLPPHGGFAIGLERFLMQLLGADNVRLVTLFPRTMSRLSP